MAGYGLSDAVSSFFDARDRQEQRAFTNRVRAEQGKQMDDQDRVREGVNAANARGAEVMRRYEQQAQSGLSNGDANVAATTPTPQTVAAPDPAATDPSAPTMGLSQQSAPDVAPRAAGLSPNAAQPSAPASPATPAAPANAGGAAPPAPGGLAAAPAPAAKYTTQPEHVLEAYDARTNELAKRGLWDQWAQSWAKSADLRQQVRAKKIDEAEADFRQTGDPLVFAKKVYPYIADGYDLLNAEQGQRQDGTPMYVITRRNQQTGEEEQIPMTKEQMLDGIRFAQNPQAVRKLEAETAMKQRDAALKIQQAQAEENIKQPGRLAVAETHAAATRDAAKTRAEAAVQAAGLSADARRDVAETRTTAAGAAGGLKVRKTISGDDGYMKVVMSDGSTKPLLDNGRPIRALDYGKRIDGIVNQLRKSSSGFGKSETDLRSMAEQSLSGGNNAPQPSASGKDFSSLWN